MMCSDLSPPRISFSHDLSQADAKPRRDASLLDMNCDFEFSISRSFRQDEPSSADELFSHGIIKPMQPRERSSVEEARHLYSLPPLSSQNPKKETTRKDNNVSSQFMDVNSPEHLDQNNSKPQSKSFWGFKRSSSLNQENKKSLLCSLPEFLRRSNSTGSAPNPKKSTIYKDSQAQAAQQKRQSSSSSSGFMSKSSSTSSSSSSSQHRMLPRPPSRKGHGGTSNYGNGVRISPVLNVPSPYISKGTAKLFRLSSFLYPEGKEKMQKK
ncbi:uncharacterized protein LOC126794521 [Argentina anserina]|uniref:uncharacterized protein LOC126794521 n=1 Tax=Argentina anserina TaxID=57926 RepID=UPI0021767FDC|nr:uncharacterized protein LOC126794521 [Potentilla anserina]